MVDIKTLLPELKKLVLDVARDLLDRVTENGDINAGLRSAYQLVKDGKRTSQVYEVWLEDYLDQVAVAWVLSCVFVRYMEDNGFLGKAFIAGEDRVMAQAENEHELYFRTNPRHSDREYLEFVFKSVGKIPACTDIFAEGKTPLWVVGPSGDQSMKLLAFWRERDADSGKLKRSFTVEQGDTRFLGDLYQSLSERARKKYALLQTPDFVEEFILDRTLTPAISEFGLDEVRLIDPTCGSGHFLLGAFARLFEEWAHRTDNLVVAAQKALHGVWGVDINPFAVAVARFRLIVAASVACEMAVLSNAPGWKVNLAVGDSLIFGSRWNKSGDKKPEQAFLADRDDSWAPDIYVCEDKKAIGEVLGQQYHAVVGNPPYITPKDKASNRAYRDRYATAFDKFHLSTPFTERFFDLAVHTEQSSGYVGLIKDNAFMKRRFGKTLVQEFFPKIDLSHVLDTSGAHIPGHGTPTVILFGRNRPPVTDQVRVVLGVKGGQGKKKETKGKVWASIVDNIDRLGAETQFTTTEDVPRRLLRNWPWSLSGGGAGELLEHINSQAYTKLGEASDSIGIAAFTLEDDAYIIPRDVALRRQLPAEFIREMVVGDSIRDWTSSQCDPVVFPYTDSFSPVEDDPSNPALRHLWPYKTNLANGKLFEGQTKVEVGMNWFEFGRLTTSKLQTPLSILFAFVATHNHFVLDRGGRIFNRSAPLIKLRSDATEEEHLALLAILNSSLACFWMKENSHNKGSTVDKEGARQRTDPFEDFYEFTATGLKPFPLPDDVNCVLSAALDELGMEYAATMPEQVIGASVPDGESLDQAEQRSIKIRKKMISIQEELDWNVYRAFELVDEESLSQAIDCPPISFGERAFEIAMARKIESGELDTTWFVRHNAKATTHLPASWPDEYSALVERRVSKIEKSKFIRLLERPEFKRRWNDGSWIERKHVALRRWLVTRLESDTYWSRDSQNVALKSVAQLADAATADSEFRSVAELYQDRSDFNMADLLADLICTNSVPAISNCVYRSAGMRKRQLWKQAWERQREQDRNGEIVNGESPPDFGKSDDFSDDQFWGLRGKLDVPREAWMSFPSCETDADPSAIVGWAGWNHVQQATAIVSYYDARKRDGWTAERLTPLLAALDQLLPWIHQWHPEVDPEYNETPGTSFQSLLDSETQELGLTIEDIRNWNPPKKKKKATRKKKTKAKA